MKIRQLFQNPLLVKISAGLISTLGIILLIAGLQKDLTLVVNGEARKINSFALTVRGVLKSQDLPLSDQEQVSPAPSTLLWGGETLYLNISSSIKIEADGKIYSLRTTERRPENILLEANLLLYPKDRILADGSPLIKNGLLSAGQDHHLQVLRGTPVTVQTETGGIYFISDADSLAEAFAKESIELFEADLLSKPLETQLEGSPITVTLIRAESLLVHLANESITIRTTADTIGAALAQGGIALQGLDYSIPNENEPLPENNQVQVIRVKEEILLNQEKIQFSSEYQASDELELDQLSILAGGEFGISAQRVRIIYENGSEVSRELEKEWVIKEPDPRIIGYGTQINLRTANTPEGEITYWRKITAYATSYNENCEGCTTYTSSGADLRQGVIAVKLDWYRYMKGMRVYIPGYGFATIEDVGGGVPWSNNWVDLGYRAINYVPWSQNVEVYFLTPTPPPENIMYVLY